MTLAFYDVPAGAKAWRGEELRSSNLEPTLPTCRAGVINLDDHRWVLSDVSGRSSPLHRSPYLKIRHFPLRSFPFGEYGTIPAPDLPPPGIKSLS